MLIRRAAVALWAATLAGCSGIERTDRSDRPTRANLAAAIEVPLILQGTISSEAMLDGNQPVVVHCQSGYRSAIAASILAQLGRSDVLDMVGGYNAWAASKLPVATTPPIGTGA